jgi:hypothetical protein
MPEEDADQPGNREDQAEAQEVPFLPQPVDICAPKQFHVFFPSAISS